MSNVLPARRAAVAALFLLTVLAAAGARASTYRNYFTGNSMTDQADYNGLVALAASRGNVDTWGRQTMVGSTISYIWYSSPGQGFIQQPYGSYHNALANYQWDSLVVTPTDRKLYVSFDQGGGVQREEGDVPMTLNLLNYALPRSPDLQLFVYSRTPRRTESESHPGTYIPLDYPSVWGRPYNNDWPGIWGRSYINKLLTALKTGSPAGSKPVKLIPMGEVFYELDARIKRGDLPGYTAIDQLYTDGSHYTNLGRYVTGLTFYASLFRESPVGLGVPANYGGLASIPPDVRDEVQDAVYSVMLRTPDTTLYRPGLQPKDFYDGPVTPISPATPGGLRVTAVPEPGVAGVVVVAASGLRRRRGA